MVAVTAFSVSSLPVLLLNFVPLLCLGVFGGYEPILGFPACNQCLGPNSSRHCRLTNVDVGIPLDTLHFLCADSGGKDRLPKPDDTRFAPLWPWNLLFWTCPGRAGIYAELGGAADGADSDRCPDYNDYNDYKKQTKGMA
eukprot:s8035_g3.t1